MGAETTKKAKKAFKKENKKALKTSIKTAAKAPVDVSLKAKPVGAAKKGGYKGKKPIPGAGAGAGKTGGEKKPYVKSAGGANKAKDKHAKSVAARLPKKKPNTQLVTVLKDQWNLLRSKTSKTARRGADDEEDEESGSEMEVDDAEGSGAESMDEDEEVPVTRPAPTAAPAVKSSEQQEKLVDALLADIRGRVMDVTLRHDASRIVQSILQFGSLDQRLVVVTELCKKAVDVSKAPYGHFAILKALTYCKSAEEQAMIVKALAGHYLSLGCNAIGARVVESMYASELLTTAQKCALNAEFYGRKYTVFLPAGVLPVSLAAVVAHTPESKYFSVLEHMQEIIQRFVNKSLFEFSYVHQFVFEYLSEIMRLDATFQHNQGGAEQAVAGAAVREGTIHTRGKFDKDKIQAEFTKRMADAIALLLDHLQRLMSTKAGCKAVLICVTYMSVKERKTFVKSLKSHVVASLTHSSAHLVIMKLVDCVDDSVLVHKSLLEELLEGAGPAAKGQEQYSAKGDLLESELPLVTVMKSAYGRKALLHMLNPFKRDPSLSAEAEADGETPNNMIAQLEPDEREYFQVRTLPAATSKKAPRQRVREHLVYLRHSALTSVFADRELVRECMCHVNASRVLTALVETFQPAALCENVLALALENAPVSEGEPNDTGERFLEDFSAHKVVQRCLQLQHRADSGQVGAEVVEYWPEVAERVDFRGALSRHLCSNDAVLRDWLSTNRLSYIIVELLKAASAAANESVAAATPKKRAKKAADAGVKSSELGQAVARILSPPAATAATPGKKGKKVAASTAVVCPNKVLTDLMA